ncbi:MAG: M3 family oligoendopeptidase, partial [Alphaproteobacteria bacterium]
AELGELPRWNLSDLYAGPECKELQSDIADARDRARSLSESHAGKIASLDGAVLGQLIADYETVQEILGRLTSYAYLRYCTNMEDPDTAQFFQNMSEAATEISSDMLFLTLELNRIDDDKLNSRLDAAPLSHYRSWLRDVRAYRPHQLSDDLERLLHEKQVSGRSSWMRLFDETVAALRFPVLGDDLTSTEVLNLLSDPDEGRRRAAAKSFGKVFSQNIRTFSLITNTLAKDKETEDKWRKFDRPISERNLSNHVEDQVVDALVEAVKQSYPRLSHRYYDLKAHWLGGEKLNYWDRNAPLPEDDDRTIPWPEAVELVISAYHAFSPQLADVGRQFFDNAWIDAPAAPGKAPGAFAHPTVPSAHPYLLLNYQGKTRDVMTLAHELGHGVHQVLAAPQGALMADTPLTLAETASVFGEQLTFRALLQAERSPSRRRVMLAGKVEDMLNTVVRQVAFCEFERQVHEQRRIGELTPERLGDIWLSTQSESLGPALHFDDEYRHFWAYIPHFIHSPFYVYAYAFGDCLVNALYAVYQDSGDGFEEKYLAMLSAGGTLRHKELLAPFGLYAGKPDFWLRGLDIVSGFVDQLEAEL